MNDLMLQRWENDLVLLKENDAVYSELADIQGGLDVPDKIRAGAITSEIIKIEGFVKSRKEALYV
jgi:hypothetical protein